MLSHQPCSVYLLHKFPGNGKGDNQEAPSDRVTWSRKKVLWQVQLNTWKQILNMHYFLQNNTFNSTFPVYMVKRKLWQLPTATSAKGWKRWGALILPLEDKIWNPLLGRWLWSWKRRARNWAAAPVQCQVLIMTLLLQLVQVSSIFQARRVCYKLSLSGDEMEIRLPDEQAGEVGSSNRRIEDKSKTWINNHYKNRLEVVDRVPQTLPRAWTPSPAVVSMTFLGG